MTTRDTILTIIGALGVAAIPFAQPASAQTTPQPPPAVTPKKPTSATPQMIEEAIQRSQARSAKQKASGAPEQWGSEEPFTYVPGKTF